MNERKVDKNALFDLSGKKALVTGGASGIGRAYATVLARAGADVAVIDLDEDRGNKVAASLRSFGVDACFFTCDVSDQQQVSEMTSAVVERFGRLDIGVNNVGTAIIDDELTYAREDWDKVMSINLTGVWLCAQAQARQMSRQNPTEGKIINTGSIAATQAMYPGNSSYDVSKAGVAHMTRSLAAQWGRFNINVNCISPSYVLTPMFAWSFPFEKLPRIREITPMGHIQRPQDLCGPILFLASSASDYVTGQNLIVDGGISLDHWLEPIERDIPPRVSEEQELIELKQDYDAMGISYDDQGVRL